jgi:phage tail-like protein
MGLNQIGAAASVGGGVVGNLTGSSLAGSIAGSAIAGIAGLLGLGSSTGRRDPNTQFCFAIEIDGITQGMFTEVQGIKWTMETEPIKEGGMNNHEQNLLGRAKFEPLTLKRGFVARENDLFGLMANTFDPNLPVRRITVSVVVLPRARGGAGEIGRFNFYNCFVQEWEGPQFNTKTSDIAIEKIIFKYDYMQFHPGSPFEQLLDAGIGAAISIGAGLALGGSLPSI